MIYHYDNLKWSQIDSFSVLLRIQSQQSSLKPLCLLLAFSFFLFFSFFSAVVCLLLFYPWKYNYYNYYLFICRNYLIWRDGVSWWCSSGERISNFTSLMINQLWLSHCRQDCLLSKHRIFYTLGLWKNTCTLILNM